MAVLTLEFVKFFCSRPPYSPLIRELIELRLRDTVCREEEDVDAIIDFVKDFLAIANIHLVDLMTYWKRCAVQEDHFSDRNLPRIQRILREVQEGCLLSSRRTREPIFFKVKCVFMVKERAIDDACKHFHAEMQFTV
jgi:hypothetical protein